MLVSSVHSPACRLNGPPPTMSTSGVSAIARFEFERHADRVTYGKARRARRARGRESRGQRVTAPAPAAPRARSASGSASRSRPVEPCVPPSPRRPARRRVRPSAAPRWCRHGPARRGNAPPRQNHSAGSHAAPHRRHAKRTRNSHRASKTSNDRQVIPRHLPAQHLLAQPLDPQHRQLARLDQTSPPRRRPSRG